MMSYEYLLISWYLYASMGKVDVSRVYVFIRGVPRTPGRESGAHSIGHARAGRPRSQEKCEHVYICEETDEEGNRSGELSPAGGVGAAGPRKTVRLQEGQRPS